MKIVVIACAGGATSSLLCSKVRKVAMENGYSCEFDFAQILDNDNMIKKLEESGLDLLILYGGAALFTKNSFSDEKLSLIKMAMIAPQMRHMMGEVEKECRRLSIPVSAIPMEDFGMMKSDKIFKQIKECLNL